MELVRRRRRIVENRSFAASQDWPYTPFSEKLVHQ